jgi:hypothetical protein
VTPFVVTGLVLLYAVAGGVGWILLLPEGRHNTKGKGQGE